MHTSEQLPSEVGVPGMLPTHMGDEPEKDQVPVEETDDEADLASHVRDERDEDLAP